MTVSYYELLLHQRNFENGGKITTNGAKILARIFGKKLTKPITVQ